MRNEEETNLLISLNLVSLSIDNGCGGSRAMSIEGEISK